MKLQSLHLFILFLTFSLISHHSVRIEDSSSPSLHQMDDDAKVSLSDGVPQRGAALPVGSINVQRTLRITKEY